MPSIRTRAIHLVARPAGMPTGHDFALVESTLPQPRRGEFVIRNRLLSVDPALRPALSNGLTALNADIPSLALGEVVASANPRFPEGVFVMHRQGLRDYALSDGEHVDIVEPIEDEPLDWHLGPLGFTGFAAYAGLFEVAALKPGEIVFVSAAAGAVGGIATQIAKQIGCRVIGSAGSDQKCRWLLEVAGADDAINYKSGVLRKSLKRAAPNGIDVYFDNVGGTHLNAALPRMRPHGRIAICGMVAAYNNKGTLSDGVTTLASTMYNRTMLRGFVWQDHVQVWPQFLVAMRHWLETGAVVAESTVYVGLESVPHALIDLLTGQNLGKTLVRLQG